MTRSQIANLREDFLHERTALLKRRVTAAEMKLYDIIISRVVAEFETEDGKIKPNTTNIDITNRLNAVFKDFNSSEYTAVVKQFATDMFQVQANNALYFKTIENDNKKLAKVTNDVNSMMSKRIGITAEGQLKKDGYLDKLIKDSTLLNKVKQETYKAVTSGVSLKDYTERMKTVIVGTPNVDGGLQKHFNTFAYQTYASFDRTTQHLYAEKLGLKAFIYAGGKIATTREFCRKNNGKVFTTDEAKDWENTIGDKNGVQWNDDPYNPLTDMGGYNCRHLPNFIGNVEAISRRAELKSVLG